MPYILLIVSSIQKDWWHRISDDTGAAHAQTAMRDYYVALSEHAGVLWIYQTRLASDEIGWFLQGMFA